MRSWQSLLLTMIINIAVPHLVPIMFHLLSKAERMCDRSCTFNHSLSKKLTQEELVELYTGPSFMLAERYSQLWNSMCARNASHSLRIRGCATSPRRAVL